MDVSVLEIFVEVMRQGSFAAVARERNIDPSSVSRTIAGLESEIGVRLFQRSTRQLAPTEAGITYFQRVEPLVEEMQQAIIAAKDISGQPKGTLRVTASVSFGLKCIVPLLPKFEAMYPADFSRHVEKVILRFLPTPIFRLTIVINLKLLRISLWKKQRILVG